MPNSGMESHSMSKNGSDRKRRHGFISPSSRERVGNSRARGENHNGVSNAEIERRYAYDRRSPSPRHHQRTRDQSRSISASPPRRRQQDPDKDSSGHRRRASPELERRTAVHREDKRQGQRSRSRSPMQLPNVELAPSRRIHVESHRSHQRRRSRSSSPKRRQTSPGKRSRNPLPSQDELYRGQPLETTDAVGPPVEKEKPNFKPTGLLAAETNKVVVGSGNTAHDIVLKYHEPPEARKPPASEPWVLYIFKGTSPDPLQTIQLHTRSCWLMGRELAVADIPVEHPSCSKQHAIFQFRYIVKKDEWGERKGMVRLYILDLESSNGTLLNGEKIDAARYTECLTGDVVRFGESEREYVLLLPPKS